MTASFIFSKPKNPPFCTSFYALPDTLHTMVFSRIRPGRIMALASTTTLTVALGGALYYRPSSTLTTGPNPGHWGGPSHYLPGKVVTPEHLESQKKFKTSLSNETVIASPDPIVLQMARTLVIGVIATVIELGELCHRVSLKLLILALTHTHTRDELLRLQQVHSGSFSRVRCPASLRPVPSLQDPPDRLQPLLHPRRPYPLWLHPPPLTQVGLPLPPLVAVLPGDMLQASALRRVLRRRQGHAHQEGGRRRPAPPPAGENERGASEEQSEATLLPEQ